MLRAKVLNSQTNVFFEQVLTPQSQRPYEYLIGRHPSCDLVLSSPEISRIHGLFLFMGEQCFFADLGSTEGTCINNVDVEVNHPQLIRPKDTIRIGNYVLLVEEVAPVAPQSAVAAANGSQTSWTEKNIWVRCIQIIEETHDVKTFRFTAEPPLQFDFQPGQFVTLDLNIDAQSVKRSYSISSSPSRPYTLDITVKRVPAETPEAPPGLVSNWMHDHLVVGSRIQLADPFGKFTCAEAQTDKLLFISAGSGITPMMSMAQWLCDTAAHVDMVFFHSARSPRDIIFRKRLELLAANHDNFQLAITTTRLVSGQSWVGYTGRLNEAMLTTIAPDFRDRSIYVCGPNPFMAATKTLLAGLQFPMEYYFSESFGPSKSRKKVSTQPQRLDQAPQLLAAIPESKASSFDDAPTQNRVQISPTVVFANSGKEVACDAEDYLLDVAEQEGIDIPNSCRMGACGACKRRLIEGEVKYEEEPGALDESDRQNGIVLACIAHPLGRVVLDA